MTDKQVLRLFQSEADYNHIAQILVASEKADNHEVFVSASDIKDRMSQAPHFDLCRDLVIIEMNGQAAAYGRVGWMEEPSSRFYKLTGFVRPEWRGKGLGRTLLGWLEERSHAIAKENHTAKASSFQINATQFQTRLHSLARQAGYKLKESWVLMVRPNLEDIPNIPLPKGLEIRPVLPEQFSTIWYAVEQAYEPEGGAAPTGVIPEDFRTDPNFQPELWQVAWEISTEKVVGSVLTYINHAENKQLGISRGYTEGISTIPAWQRMGVARALISRSLQAQRGAGMTESALVCSGEKPDNYRLYMNCGFNEVKRDTVYEKQLT